MFLVAIKFTCLVVKIVLRLRARNSVDKFLLQKSLYSARACLYRRKFSGIDLLYILCKFTNDTSFKLFFAQILMAFADADKSFCFKVLFNVGKCQISEL